MAAGSSLSCPVCRAVLEHPEQMDCPACGSLEGLDLAGGSFGAKAKLFSYDWASGFIAPFRKADLTAARAAIDAAVRKLKTVQGLDASCIVDLGCGDGEVLLDAALSRGIRGWGAELDAELVVKANELIEKAQADVTVEEVDIMTLPASAFLPGTVVFCYLLPAGLEKLRPVLREALERRDCVLTTLTWPVPGLDDMLCPSSAEAPFNIYCAE